jgi:hypothetical protein
LKNIQVKCGIEPAAIENLNQPTQTVRQNKNECTQLMEQTYELINAILMAHIKSNTGGKLPPSVLTYIGKFTEHVA